MSSEPIEKRVSDIGDRLKSSRCLVCGKEYFKTRKYCGYCGRKSLGNMEDVDLFYEKGVLESCTIVKESTNRFKRLGSYIYGIVSFHNGKVRIPGRLTDRVFAGNENIKPMKNKSRDRIDVIVALINAMNIAIRMEDTKSSIYEQRGMRSLL